MIQLFNFTIKYTINGVLQPEFHWNGTILTDEIKEIVLQIMYHFRLVM